MISTWTRRCHPFIAVAVLGFALSSAAHRAPGSLTTIEWNPASEKTEIVHRLHSHDAELGVGAALDIPDLSVHDLEGRANIALYVEARFSITSGEDNLRLELVGAELVGDYILVYQVQAGRLPQEIRVFDSILRDIYPEQINQVNIQDGDSVRTLAFSDDDDWHSYRFGQFE